ncbi:MAG: hypothetical protein M1140_07515 [Chloroflexi bacterium]|nr:hypothetical protein [Chloroflexota bacterium]
MHISNDARVRAVLQAALAYRRAREQMYAATQRSRRGNFLYYAAQPAFDQLFEAEQKLFARLESLPEPLIEKLNAGSSAGSP